jgi:acetyl esterase/lipase
MTTTNKEKREYRDIPYLTVEGVYPNLLSPDIFIPDGDGPFPVLMMIHGGG